MIVQKGAPAPTERAADLKKCPSVQVPEVTTAYQPPGDVSSGI